MSWLCHSRTFRGYGYQDYGSSQFGGHSSWTKFTLPSSQWGSSVSDTEEWQVLSKSHVQWNTITGDEVSWEKED